MPDDGGVKHDQGKPMFSLISADAMEELAKVLTYGASKYQDHNWRKGFKWQRVMDAAYRHLAEYNKGKRVDPETGLSHLAHAMCNIMFLIEFEKNNIGEDNLWKGHKKND